MPPSPGPETDIFAPYDARSSRDLWTRRDQRATYGTQPSYDPEAVPYEPVAPYDPRFPVVDHPPQDPYDSRAAYDQPFSYDTRAPHGPDPQLPTTEDTLVTRPHRTHAVDRAPVTVGAGGMKGVLLPVAVVLLIGTIFVSVYLAAFHAPAPHRLPVAVVGSSQALSEVERGLDKGVADGFSVRGYANEADAREALVQRQVYAAYITTGKTPTLLYAGANGTGVTSTLTGAFGALAKATGQHLTAHDADPSAAGDTRGLSVFYAAFGVVLAGFLYGTMTYQLAPALTYRLRMLSLGVFGVLGGILVTLVAGRGFDALPGSFVAVAGVVALMATAAGGATMVLLRMFGPAGVTLATITLLILGNASGGGILPADYLPGWLHPLHAILPVGVGIRAIQGLSYFHSDGFGTGLTILGVWTAVCAIVLYVRDVWSVRLLARTP